MCVWRKYGVEEGGGRLKSGKIVCHRKVGGVPLPKSSAGGQFPPELECKGVLEGGSICLLHFPCLPV